MRHSAEIQAKPILLLIMERLRNFFAYQCYFQSEDVSAYLVLFRIPVYLICLSLCLTYKAAPGIGPISISR